MWSTKTIVLWKCGGSGHSSELSTGIHVYSMCGCTSNFNITLLHNMKRSEHKRKTATLPERYTKRRANTHTHTHTHTQTHTHKHTHNLFPLKTPLKLKESFQVKDGMFPQKEAEPIAYYSTLSHHPINFIIK